MHSCSTCACCCKMAGGTGLCLPSKTINDCCRANWKATLCATRPTSTHRFKPEPHPQSPRSLHLHFLNPNSPSAALNFVGRSGELAQLHSQLASALAGNGQISFVTGEAGFGKSALLQAFARRTTRQFPQMITLLGNCNAYTGLGDPICPSVNYCYCLWAMLKPNTVRVRSPASRLRICETLHPVQSVGLWNWHQIWWARCSFLHVC